MNKYAKGDKVRIKDLECIPRDFVGKIVTIKEIESPFNGVFSYSFEGYECYCSEDCLELIEIGENNDLLNGIINKVVEVLSNKK